jgi:tetratricopeptide (TPR) repeat protein
VDTIVDLVRRRAARCVTVTGMIGIGKTRVLDEARRKLAGVPHVRFVDSTAHEQALAIETHDDILVVASPTLRGGLHEREVALGGLRIPEAGAAADLRAIRRSPAVALLSDAARIDLDLITTEELRALARIARAADGHPAVLEQLAGWLWRLSPAEVAGGIDEGSIACVPRDLARRLKRGLRALAPDEREVLAAVAEANAPFDLQLARAAVRAQRRPGLPAVLASLVAGGWLARAGRPEAPRMRVPTPFRVLLRGRARGMSRRRLTLHFAARARSAVLDRAVADRSKLTALLEARDEVLASWEDAHARRDPAELALAAALASVATSGDPAVAQHAARIRSSIDAHPRDPRRARLEIACGDALWFSGDPQAADACFETAIARARTQRDRTIEAFGWTRRATLGPELGRLDVAEAQLARANELARTSNEPLVLTLATGIRGFLRRAAGDQLGALAAFDEQAELARRAGDVFYTATADASAADCHLVLGEHAFGRLRYARAFTAMKQVDAAWAHTLEGYMGLAAWEVGALAEAASRCRRATRAAVGPRFRVVFAAARAGVLAELGEHARASSALTRAEEAAAEHGSAAAPAESALLAAGLLVALARSAHDDASRRAVTHRIRVFLRTRGPAVSEDERPFIAALGRATKRTSRGGATPARASHLEVALEGRPRLARVLAALRSCSVRDEVVTSLDLFRAAWPDEPTVDGARAEARVRKAISLLRELGLRGAIVTTERGYRLT